MKKLVAILLAGVLTIGGAVTAFAAPSPTAQQGTGKIATYTAANLEEGDKVITKNSFEDAAEQAAADAIKADPAAKAQEAGIPADVAAKLTVNSVFDLTLQSGKDYNGTATVTFNVPGVTADSTAYVLHWENGKWVNVTSSKGNGTITATFANGFSPVAILVDASTLKTNASSTGSSPKTGEAPYMAVMFAVAAAAVAGMAISRKKFA